MFIKPFPKLAAHSVSQIGFILIGSNASVGIREPVKFLPSVAVILASLTMGLSAFHGSRVFASDSHPPFNFLFLSVDDLRPELGCYGVNEIHTPEIDRLASRSVLFQRAYCQVAVCNPSRVSLMTGLRPDTTRVWDLVTRFRQTTPDAVTLPQQLRKHGYYAASFGKIFHNPWPDNPSWSEPHSWPPRKLWSDQARKRLEDHRQTMREKGEPERAIQRLRPQATERVKLADDEHVDGAIANQAIQAMRRIAEREQPFFLAVGFVRPHLPFVVPEKYWDLYEPDEIPLAENRSLPTNAPDFAMNTMYELRDYVDFVGTPSPRTGSLTESQQRRLRHGYYASVSFVDSLIGKLLRELEQLGLSENTVVVLWSDHGWKLGEHNSWCKQTNHEIDARVPLIIHVPQAVANGKQSSALVELLDLYPTICDLAGVPIPTELEGISLRPIFDDPDSSVKEQAFSQFRRTHEGAPLMGYSMRTNDVRYIEWIDRRNRRIVAQELYDHRIDPNEAQNLAGNSRYDSMLKRLHQTLWERLPQPPAYTPSVGRRPQVTFQNEGLVPVTLWWLKPDGTEVRSGVIDPGKQTRRNTTLGHRFRMTSEGGLDQHFEVTKRQEVVRIP